MICASYVASFLCGISLRHLQERTDTPKTITSMARYHLYYQKRKFVEDPAKLEEYRDDFGTGRHVPPRETQNDQQR